MIESNSVFGSNELVLKKKILSLREHYDIEDRKGNKLGEAEGNFFQVPAKFTVRDAAGSELVRIGGRLISFRKEFAFHDSTGSSIGTIKKKLVKLVGEEFWVEREGKEYMRIYGNFTEHDYRFEVNKTEVARVHRNWVSVRDTLNLSLTGDADHRLTLGALIVIEHIEVTERNNN